MTTNAGCEAVIRGNGGRSEGWKEGTRRDRANSPTANGHYRTTLGEERERERGVYADGVKTIRQTAERASGRALAKRVDGVSYALNSLSLCDLTWTWPVILSHLPLWSQPYKDNNASYNLPGFKRRVTIAVKSASEQNGSSAHFLCARHQQIINSSPEPTCTV